MASDSQGAGSDVANGVAAPAPAKPVELPVHPAKRDPVVPPPGQALTGKQEHCAFVSTSSPGNREMSPGIALTR